MSEEGRTSLYSVFIMCFLLWMTVFFTHFWSEHTGLHESALNKYYAKKMFAEETLGLLVEQQYFQSDSGAILSMQVLDPNPVN